MDDLFDEFRAIEAGLAPHAELHRTRFEREERVIFAHADTFAGKDARTALAHDNCARFRGLSVGNLHAEEFRL